MKVETTRIRGRLGRFSISEPLIERILDGEQNAQAAWCAVFGQVVVIEATRNFCKREIEYLAYSEQFDESPEGIEAPEYTVTISMHREPVGPIESTVFSVKFTRIT